MRTRLFVSAIIFAVSCVVVFAAPSIAKSQRGVWRSTSEPKMVAHITKDTIRIDWVEDDDTRALYWKGTWHTVRKNGAKVTSFGDTEAMEYAMLASTLDKKTFIYSNGQIVFSLSIMGITRKIRLQKK